MNISVRGGKKHEVVQSHNDKPLTTCPDCGEPMTKLISSTSFVLKERAGIRPIMPLVAEKRPQRAIRRSQPKREESRPCLGEQGDVCLTDTSKTK